MNVSAAPQVFRSAPTGGLNVMQKPVRRALAALLTTVALVGSAAAQYPNKPIKWVVPYPPAGTTDVLARIVAQSLSENIGQQVVVENKPGAGNNIGTEFVINSPPDGYTMLLVNPANGINASLYKKLSFNFVRDIAPVAGLVRTPNVMVLTTKLPMKTVAEFLAYCKANPGKVSMASSGRAVQIDDRLQHGSRALQGRRAGAD